MRKFLVLLAFAGACGGEPVEPEPPVVPVPPAPPVVPVPPAPPPQTTHVPVRVVYAYPADKYFRWQYGAAIDSSMNEIQAWYAEELDGTTFALYGERVETCQLAEPERVYADISREQGDAWMWRMYMLLFDHLEPCLGERPGFGGEDPSTIWMLFFDIHEACNITYPALGRASWGVALLGAWDLEGLIEAEDRLCDRGNSYARKRWVGGQAHELGHAFGLPHPPGCDAGLPSCDSAALMASGSYSFPDTYLRADEMRHLRGTGLLEYRLGG
ncbi:hypothetical protein [Candidatus Palauibacter sp.]|uniref:hypothetical protein n=1 Tax=Candidatus Palauibacter sp. TaxID=3101350 RepID=UPI003B0233A6